MNDGPLFASRPWNAGLEALRADLTAPGGPRISTMRNHRFAIVPYPPKDEFPVRLAAGRVADELRRKGWHVRELSLQALLLARLAAVPADEREALVARERSLQARRPDRAFSYVSEHLKPMLEGPKGLAQDIVREVDELVREHPGEQDRSVVFLSRLGALYPFARPSAFFASLADRTQQVSVVLLYPGDRGPDGLSFLGRLSADRDYRARIYP